MVNNNFFTSLLSIGFLAFLQVFVFNNIVFHNWVCPYIYVIFPLFYPPQKNIYVYYILCFILGFTIDFLMQTGGIHTFAIILIAYTRLRILKILDQKSDFNIEEFQFSEFNGIQWFFYIVIMILLHHFALFILENFKLSNFGYNLLKALASSGLSFIFVLVYSLLFRKKSLN